MALSAKNPHITDLSRLKWRCRRGLLELDLLFNRFVDDRYLSLDADMQQAFWSLLNETDHSILAWIQGTESCPSPKLKHIIRIIIQSIENKDKKITNS